VNVTGGELLTGKYMSIGQYATFNNGDPNLPRHNGDAVLNISGGEVLAGQSLGGPGSGYDTFCGGTSQASGTINLSGNGYLAVGRPEKKGSNKSNIIIGNAEFNGVGTVNISDNAELYSRALPDVYTANDSCINLLTPETAVLRVKNKSGIVGQLENLITSGGIKNWEGSSELCDFTITRVKVGGRYENVTYTVTANGPIIANLDILPEEDPNLFAVNMQSKGRLPMAILGSNDYDINDIDISSLSVAGTVLPVRTPKIEKDVNGDGLLDLVIHVSRRDVIAALGLDLLDPGTVVDITVNATMLSCGKLQATDSVILEARSD
ncbi:MAG: hypothetical protein ACYTF1_17145, partial [Planctomycetota bacterium]